jgi:hypothetical protein
MTNAAGGSAGSSTSTHVLVADTNLAVAVGRALGERFNIVSPALGAELSHEIDRLRPEAVLAGPSLIPDVGAISSLTGGALVILSEHESETLVGDGAQPDAQSAQLLTLALALASVSAVPEQQ